MSDDDDFDRPSKTQRKKAMQDLQSLGEALVDLSHEQLAKFTLPDILRDAVLEAKRITKHEARRRQGQYIGRLMRDADADVIRAQINRIKGKSAELVAYHHRLERWRDRMLGDDQALDEFAVEYPQYDAQHLRQLVRNARKERIENKAPKAYRQLFQVLKEVIIAPAPEDDARPASEGVD